MKLSRHGKHTNHSRRGRRHTKRAGKHLKYRGKKVRVSKRYSRVTGGRGRGRGHTKKNLQNIYGRRFMKGGVVCGGFEYDWVWGTSADGQNFTCTIEVTLRYKKNLIRSITAANSQFQVVISVGSNFKGCKAKYGIWGYERLSLKFIRQTPDSPLEFQFDTYLDFISALGEHIVDWVPSSRNFVRDIISNVPMRYNFNFKENTKILDCIRDFIRNKIIDVYIDTLWLLGSCTDESDNNVFYCTDSKDLFGDFKDYYTSDTFDNLRRIKDIESSESSESSESKEEKDKLKFKIYKDNMVSYQSLGITTSERPLHEIFKSNIELLILIGKCILIIYGGKRTAIEPGFLFDLKGKFIYIINNIRTPFFFSTDYKFYENYKIKLKEYLGEMTTKANVLDFISDTFPGRPLSLAAAAAVVPAPSLAAAANGDDGDDGTAVVPAVVTAN